MTYRTPIGAGESGLARHLSVDTLRGIACILLVTVHVAGFNEGSGIGVPDDHPLRWFGDSFRYLRMPLFVFLSGFVYAWRPLTDLSSYSGFMGKKARRLLIPYLIFVPAIGLTLAVTPGANTSVEINPLSWLVYSISPYWFLLATFWMFAVTALVDGLGLFRDPRVLVGVITSIVLLNQLLPAYSGEFLQLGTAFTLYGFFLSGVAVSRFGWTLGVPRRLRVMLVVCFVLLFAYTQLGIFGVVPDVDSRRDIIGVLLGVAFPVAWLSLSIRVRWLAWIGGYSSGIFLIHPFVVAPTRILLIQVGADDPWLQFGLCSTVGIIGSIGVVMVMRLLPVGRVALGEKW
ncbi:hypothetical protein BHE97_06985 [Aeromicrobium sp. PE09-221]|uniref:acyltransferase family protein n=1 Tax=Aeromicrobium sp. PE09-221 TaxID=1898043 RepID=UPI000B663242|nr:acyltransferase [Aeromicrobium sp. PE09-221]OUZ10500.1 hypothetical protein BHE97_06985 [Aeromicrobium sp. PE09-221]